MRLGMRGKLVKRDAHHLAVRPMGDSAGGGLNLRREFPACAIVENGPCRRE